MAALRAGRMDGTTVLRRRLAEAEAAGVRMLHRRAVDGVAVPIDHVVLTPAGVHVIDAAAFRGAPRIDAPRGIVGGARRLVVGDRDCTPLVDLLGDRTRAVRTMLDTAGLDSVPLHPVLCLVDARWPPFGGFLRLDGVLVLSVRRLLVRLRSGRDLEPGAVLRAFDVLSEGLAPA